MTKIDIISGFLGAGKTTFIKQLLKEAASKEKVLLIENEFGEIGIDSGFLKDSGVEIREMNSGCICCSLVGDFEKSLSEALTKYNPDRVIIEPSGVGKLSDVMKAVRDVAETLDVLLNSAVTIVDAGKCRMYMKNFGEFFNNQVEHAGTIILSRTDITDKKKVQAAVELLRGRNKHAVIVTTPCSELTSKQLLEMIEKKDDMAEMLMKEAKEHHDHEHTHDYQETHEAGCSCGHDHEHTHDHQEIHEAGCSCGHDHEHTHDHQETHEAGCSCGHDHEHTHDHQEMHEAGCSCGHDHEHTHDHQETHEAGCSCGHDHTHHHADEVFTSWGKENVSEISREKLEGLLNELAYGIKYGEVLRAKGMLPEAGGAGKWLHFDLVPEQVEIREGAADYTGKICVIGADLNKEALEAAFTAE